MVFPTSTFAVFINCFDIWHPQLFRMLERRVSNQRQDLSSDQQMNYLLSWFVNWSDLQKVRVNPEANQQFSNRRILFLSWLRRCPISGQQVEILMFTYLLIILRNRLFFCFVQSGLHVWFWSIVFSSTVNGVCDELQSLGVEGRPVSLFQCQVLFLCYCHGTW